MYCKNLADLTDKEEKIVGGKAWNLSLLLKQDVLAPGGFIIFSRAFEEFLSLNEIEFSTCSPEDITKHDLKWPEVFSTELTDLLKALSATVPESTLFAVRSSGLLEDSAKLSFAGIHESILMVEKKNLFTSLQECWSSTRTDRAINYRKVNGLPDSPNLAVLVQPMISSKISGVLFSINPMTSADEIIIEAAEGYCDQIVSGKITPEKITLQKQSDLVPKSEVISIELGQRLRKTAMQIENYFKFPVDIEWTWDGLNLWILQARPITKRGEAVKSDGRTDLYSNKNSKEVMGHAVTLMTWSAFNAIINKAMKTRYKQKGIKYSKKQPFYELKWGRVYQNVTTTYHLMAKEFGADLKTIIKEFEDISPDMLKNHLPNGKSSKIKGLSNILGHLFKSKEFIDKAEKNWKNYNDFCLDMRARDFDEDNEKKLFGLFNEVQDTFADFGKIYMDLQIYLSIFKEVVWQGLEKKENGALLFASLLTGLGDVVTVEQDEKLLEIAQMVKENDTALQFFKQEAEKLDWDELCSLLKDRSPIVKELRDFRFKYGYRSKIELEVAEPRWSDAPSDILKFIQISINAQSTRQSKVDLFEQRHQAEKKVSAAQNVFMRPLYNWAVGKFQAMSRLRENCKAVVVHFIAVQRKILLNISLRLLAQKRFVDVDDIFHLSIEELETVIEGKWTNDVVQDYVTKNKSKWLKNRDLSPPSVFLGEEPIFSTNKNDEQSMKGTAASPGQVTGKALVLSSPTEVSHIEPGTILIASTTDPYWTPLFMHVVAVVTEHGGLLSHAAITAREFGLPAVLGIDNVTKTITTGTQLFVDGSAGVIKIVELNK